LTIKIWEGRSKLCGASSFALWATEDGSHLAFGPITRYMKKKILYVAGALTLLWGISHLFPTSGVVEDFGDISSDNKLIITME